MGRRLGKSLGGTARGQQMVSESDLVNALSLFSGNAAASIESRQNVGPLVLDQPGMRGRIRCSGSLFLRLGRLSLSRVRVFIFDWTASGRRALDSRALHVRFRPGDVQLLRPDQSLGAEHGLSQRAPRSAVDPVEQSAETACDGAGILRQSEVSLIVEPLGFAVHF